jgi:hypothetical protein
MRFTRSAYAVFYSKARVSIIAAPPLASMAASAQERRSAILGAVKDQSGAAIAGATGAATNTETDTTAKLSTNS